MRSALVLLTALLLPGAAWPQPTPSRDTSDGGFDASEFLLEHRGVLPVPVIITEPAVGYGGGLMLLYFSESRGDSGGEGQASGERKAPPNITGIGGLATENGTRGGALFHFHSWAGDRYRYLGALAQGRANLDYYGAFNHGRSYEVKGTFLLQQALAKLGDSPWYLGPRYTYFRSNTRFTGATASELSAAQMSGHIGKAGLVLDYDTRDNIFYPNRGSYARLQAEFARSWLGSDQSFEAYGTRGYSWVPLAPRWTLGLRADGQFTRGTVPFYAQPYVDLRGVSRGRYQDRDAVAVETELRWNLTPRWSLLGFTGAGKAYGNWRSFSEATTVVSVGAGFRYLIASKLGLAVGVDVAHSKDQNAFYIQIGSAWR
ncbi:Surface antigen [compost metagenome]|uniref:BamA/TamA family outer membrane protein n=1 Tax=Achromobacter sp. Root83 TaxID=1736602 RepID=UPI00070E0F31|nr:BamA/TamA family outer membrane protein [Achromobacter sp. Root83]KRC80531.1 glyceraldehyde-3-phosphate dehydrogenase [Achromobacter sp. Root83]